MNIPTSSLNASSGITIPPTPSNSKKLAYNNTLVIVTSVALTALSMLAASLVFVYEVKVNAVVLPYLFLSAITLYICYRLSIKFKNRQNIDPSSFQTPPSKGNFPYYPSTSPIPHDIEKLTKGFGDPSM